MISIVPPGGGTKKSEFEDGDLCKCSSMAQLFLLVCSYGFIFSVLCLCNVNISMYFVCTGILVEGLGSFLGGIMGTGNGTTSTSINVGVVGLTKVQMLV